MRAGSTLWVVALLLNCGGETNSEPDAGGATGVDIASEETAGDDTVDAPDVPEPPDEGGDSGSQTNLVPFQVLVLLDGEPSPNTLVVQGGNPARWTTGPEGSVTAYLDLDVFGDLVLMASHADARIEPILVDPESVDPITISLTSFDTSDNPDYIFKDPGVPGDSDVIEKCGHCHVTIQEGWYDSTHRTATSNPTVQDIYTGAASAANTETACGQLGGTWKEGTVPGSDLVAERCYVGPDVKSTNTFGGCADCHAPGINGQLGGRDLSEAQGWEYDYGVHCDVCHRVESVDLQAPPGVAGRLKLLRPSEAPPFPGLGEFTPLTFGPNPDVGNIYMGSVQRDHYRKGDFCAGCHEQEQAVLVPGSQANTERWPDGKLPIHSTWSEWNSGPLAAALICQDCHMPANPDVWNGADLQTMPKGQTGITAGWLRPPGSTHEHFFEGPRTNASQLLQGSVSLSLEQAVEDGELVAKVTTTNIVGAHAVPTGEPMRSLVLLVQAECNGQPLKAVGGHAVPDFGGALAQKEQGEDWTIWPGAKVGQVLRVVSLPGGYHDYPGFGSFGNGTFSAEQKGLPIEHVVGQSTIVATDGDTVSLDASLPQGDRVYLGNGTDLPENGTAATARAGAPGFAFARVLTGAGGERMVPHFLAVDVASDNRLMPETSWTSEHRFQPSGCDSPKVTAVLLHRAYPLPLARARGWTVNETVVTSVQSK